MKHISDRNTTLILGYLLSLLMVLLIGSILILIQGSNPIEAYLAIVRGALGNKAAIASSIRWSIPVIIASMASVIATRSGIINLGLDGQIYLGAFTAALIGAFLPLPGIIHKLVAIVIGGLAGSLFALIPALLKAYWKINEMVTTLMLNYAAVLFTEFFTIKLMGFGADTSPDMIATPEILETAKLIRLLPPYQASSGIFIGLIIFLVVFIVYKKTMVGYEWNMIGRNMRFAQYGGVKTIKNYIIVFLTSAFVAGICGAVEILGPHVRFRSYFSSNLGWDGIMVALIGKGDPLSTLIVALIWGMIKAGSLSMERTTSVNRILVTLIQALFVLFVTVDYKSLLKDLKMKSIGKKGKLVQP
jgi:ABC-type uncharacterized transport system permease subunit